MNISDCEIVAFATSSASTDILTASCAEYERVCSHAFQASHPLYPYMTR